MAELINKDRTDIGRHIRHIYKEGEQEKDITCVKFAHMVLRATCNMSIRPVYMYIITALDIQKI